MREQKSSATPMTLIRRAKQLIDGVTSMVWRVEDEPGHSTRSASASRMSKVAPVRPRAHLQAAQELERAQTDLDAAFRAFAGYEAESAARERMAELRQARDSAQLGSVGTTGQADYHDRDSLTLAEQRGLIRATVATVTVARGRGADRASVQFVGE
jgi:hypothetical protein